MLPSFLKRRKKGVMYLTLSTQKDTDPEQVEFYRGCSIDLTLRTTNNWNELWSYEIISDYGQGTNIGKGNGLASKSLAMKAAKGWIDNDLRDRRNSVLRDDWLSLKLNSRNDLA
jgi:hypothetical protein